MDLGAGAQVTGLQIFTRDNCCQWRAGDLEVRLGDSDLSTTAINTQISLNQIYAMYAGTPSSNGQVRLDRPGNAWL